MDKSTIILDCTLRDGGYYNDWDFDRKLVTEYLEAMHACQVDFVEIGFRSLINKSFRGGLAYSTEEYLEQLVIPESLSIGVMVNANEFRHFANKDKALIKLFPRGKNDSKVKLVRLATTYSDVDIAIEVANSLKGMDFNVAINLMKMSELQSAEISNFSNLCAETPIDTIYFADSLGALNFSDIDKITRLIKASSWGERALGIHAHNNMGRANLNSIYATEMGVTWVDATVMGMGRGPGNAKTEDLLLELDRVPSAHRNLTPLVELINNHFKPLKIRFNWGCNTFYYLAGKHKIHPTYIQTMVQDKRYSTEDILSAIDYLKSADGTSFYLDKLICAANQLGKNVEGEWDPCKIFNEKEILLIASGPSMKAHKEGIEKFIEKYRPIVVAFNTHSPIADNLIDIRIACHPVRILADIETHKKQRQPLITPQSILPKDIIGELDNKTILNYGANVAEDKFILNNKTSIIPSNLVISYALAVVTVGKASKVYMAGFDGYEAGDPRNGEIDNILKLYSNIDNSKALISITKTKYVGLIEKSVYGF